MNAVVEEAPVENSPLTISDIMARMFEIRAARKAIEAQDSELVQEWETLEGQLLGKLEEQGSVRVASKLGTASISEQTLGLIEDWDTLEGYIKENDALHLYQRRLAVGAYRELLAAGVEVPGVRPITKKSINLRVGT